MKIAQRYSYVWVTSVLFLLTLLGHWSFGWAAYRDEQESFGLPVDTGEYTNMMCCAICSRTGNRNSCSSYGK